MDAKHFYWKLRELVRQKKNSLANKSTRLNRITRSAFKNGIRDVLSVVAYV